MELPLPDTNAETIYDVAVIGGGPAGYPAAIRGAEYGLKVALIDASPRLGGTCLHVGCIPTKALLFNAELWDYLKEAEEFGIKGVEARQLDWAAVLARKSAIITKHVKGIEFLMKKHKIAVIPGFARLTGPAQSGVHTVEVEANGQKSSVKAKNVMIATGSEAKLLPGLKADETILTNIEILSLNAPPKSLIVIGAGAVGVEFASIFRSFGSEVTILEFLPRMVSVEDEEISKELARVFRKRGIETQTGAKVEKVEKTAAGVKVSYTDANGKPQVKEAEKVLVAVGRGPLTNGIGLEKTRVELERGSVKVNEAQETAEPGVFAIGDIVAGLPQLAHVGAMSGMVAMAKIAGLHVYRAADRQRGPDRSAGQRKGSRNQGGQVSVCRQLQGNHRGQPRRLCEGDCRRQVRRDSRRAHHRPAGHGTDCRGGCRDGARRHGGRADVHHPRAPHAERSDAGRLRRGGGDGD
jgi:dihydrolipoamide dehydrogenase